MGNFINTCYICEECGLRRAYFDIDFDGNRGLICGECNSFTIIPSWNLDVERISTHAAQMRLF